jgi:hypothetical protein
MENALEASRYLTGRWPEGPADAAAWRAVEALAMAPESASTYYFARREGAIVLLAPER